MELFKPNNNNAFARDPSHAENARANTMAPAGPSEDLSRTKTIYGSDSGFTTRFNANAKIWELYLDHAERAAKEQVEIWKTWLDSLLIFAGLFAGVVASFVVDVTDNSESNNTPQPSPTRTLWTSGLWFCSLIITIFGAIMGVLAKVWIANFIPVSNRREAEDAHLRLMLDKQAERWRLERVILVIPLLVQIASFLFAFGFAIQTFNSNIVVGVIIAVLVSTGVAAYLVSTIIATQSSRSFPFRTPLSDLLVYLKKLRKPIAPDAEQHNNLQLKPSVDLDLAGIWRDKLIKSRNKKNVNEAIAELVRQWPNIDEWQNYFCQPEVLKVLLHQLSEYVMLESYYKTKVREELCSYLEGLMQLVHHVDSNPLGLLHVSSLKDILSNSLQPKGPLFHWNIFPEDIRPLAFCVRIHILALEKQSGSFLGDIFEDVVAECPWENMFYYVRDTHRFKFLVAACRGLIEGQKMTQIISTHILSLSLARASVRGLISEPIGPNEMLKKAEIFEQEYLTKLLESVVKYWMLQMQLNDVMLNNHNEVQDPDITSAANSLLSMLLHPNSALRLGGITILSNSLMSDLKSNFINEYFKIPTLAKLMIGDKDEEVRESSLMLMLQLLNKNDWGLQQDIEKAISKEVDAGLNNTLKLYVLRSLSNINKVNHELLITIITKASATQLTNMIFLASDAEIHDKSQYIIRCLLTDGIFHNEVTETMIEYLDNMFKYSSPGTHFQIVDLTLKLLKDFSSYSTNFLKDNINSWIETIIIKHAFSFEDVYNASKTTICARNWLSHFTGKDDREMPNDSFQILYNKNVTDLKNIFTGGNSEIEFNKWKNAVSTALRERLSKELASDMWTRHALSAQFCQDMSWVPELIQLVTKNEGENVENEASESLKWIFKNANCDDIANAIKSSKSSFLKLINAVFSDELSFETQSVLIEIVDLILKRIDFTDGVRNMINGTISCQYHETRSMALAMLKSLVYTKSGSIPDELITPPEDFQLSLQELPAKWEAGIHWLELLTSLKQHIAKAEKIALNIISPLIANIRFITNRKSPVENHSSMPVHEQQDIGETLPAGSSNELCTYWVQAIGVLAVYYPEEMKNSLPILSDMAYNNESEEVRVATLKALTMITRTGKFKKEVQEFVSKRTQSSSDTEVFFFINIWESLILEGEFNLPLESLLKAAVTGNKYERWVYLKALKSLNILAKQEEEKLQESLKSTVSSIVEMPPSDLDWDIRRKWVKLYAMLAQKKHQYAVSIISKIAREDDDIDVQLEAIASLTSLLLKKDDKIRETLMKAVPLKFLDSVLNKQNHQAQCQAWAKLTSLLPPSSEQSFIPNLVKTSVSHTSENVKLIILELLITRDASESAILDLLSKQITQALKNPEDEVRMWAISTMELITAIGIAHGTNTIKPILSSVMPNVLKIIMNEVKSNIQSDAERIFQTMCANFGAKDITILRSSVSGIAEYLESITDKGRHFITLFVRTLAIGYRLDATVLKAVRDVASVLKNNSHSRLVRTTVLELLGYFNMREPCFTVIDSIIPDIIFIVLHDTDDNIRLLALNLIIQVANRDESGELCLSDIRRHHQLLMSLLEIDDLMHAAAEILSLLTKEKSVRKNILLKIISSGISQDAKLHEGHIFLLTRLIIDKRLGNESIDYVAILLIPTLVERPQFTHLKFQVVSFLHRNYGDIKIVENPSGEFPVELRKWFQLAVFGRHITSAEVNTWNSLSSRWLPNAEVTDEPRAEPQNPPSST